MKTMHDKKHLERLIERHKNFWNLSNQKKPLIGKLPHPQWKPRPYPLKSGEYVNDPKEITPDDVDIDKLLGLDKELPELLVADMISVINTVYPVSWMGSLIGCPIYASGYSCSTRPVVPPDTYDIPPFSVEEALNSPWLAVMDGMLKRASEAAGGRIAVSQLHLRGVIDMLAALLGENTLCIAFYDKPAELEKLAEKFTELYLKIANKGINLRTSWKGGFVSSWGIYAPGPILDYQIDATSILSPEIYKQYILEFDRKIISNFPYSVLHMHACGLHMTDNVLEIDELKAIEIVLERETGVWKKEYILECCEKIQKKKKGIIINGELNEDELKEFTTRLDPNGLAIFYWNPAPS